MSDWIDPFLGWQTTSPITTSAFRRIEGNISHLRDGVTQFSNNKQFSGEVEVLGQLISRAQTILREIVQISGALEMLGNVTINERPGFPGTGNVTIGGTGELTVGGNTILTGTLDISNLGPRTVSTLTPVGVGASLTIPAGFYYGSLLATGEIGGTVGITPATGPDIAILQVNTNPPVDLVQSGGLIISDGVNAAVNLGLGTGSVTLTLIALSD